MVNTESASNSEQGCRKCGQYIFDHDEEDVPQAGGQRHMTVAGAKRAPRLRSWVQELQSLQKRMKGKLNLRNHKGYMGNFT